MKLDFTTTATIRPDVYRRTLETFALNLRGVDMAASTLYLNLDPIPWDQYQQDYSDWSQVVEHYHLLAKQFFGTVQMRAQGMPNFAAAVKWCWSQPKTQYFFHLEDDWELKCPIDLTEVMKYMSPNISVVNLRAYNFDPLDRRICLSPGIHRTAHSKIMAERMVPTANPEKQLRAPTPTFPDGGKQGDYIGVQYPSAGVIIRDLGRDWLDKSGWKKTAPVFFNTWEKK